MNRQNVPLDNLRFGTEKAFREDRHSGPDALALLSSLISQDSVPLELRGNFTNAEYATYPSPLEKNGKLRVPELLRRQSSVSFNSASQIVSERLDPQRTQFLYGSTKGRSCRRDPAQNKQRESVLLPRRNRPSLSNIMTLSKRNEKCVRKTLSQDWSRRTFSPRPGRTDERGTMDASSIIERHPLMSISEEVEKDDDEGSDLSDNKCGLEDWYSDIRTHVHTMSMAFFLSDLQDEDEPELSIGNEDMRNAKDHETHLASIM
ncbi:unnamed protein product [Agarophyton chilense]|eukprot:gb/GEZJ01001378.1/.p1 GENE.gb/GEZJ01001378.1/~~gb/GEZJ01001378.1/.p1  ORF type:complete len:261 (+),score=29.43 gb/GEZJ01001378.1/:139-921(+)